MGNIAVRVLRGGRCEDCDLRDALTLSGHPRRHPTLGYRLTAGCEACGGTGKASITYRIDAKQLRCLTPKQRFVLERRLGLHDGRKYTQQEIADSLGIGQPKVSELESRARQRLIDLLTPDKKTG